MKARHGLLHFKEKEESKARAGLHSALLQATSRCPLMAANAPETRRD